MSFRKTVQDRFLKDMLSSLPEKGWKILVVDHDSLAILSSVCRVSDVMAKNITIVENLNLARQPFPQMEAVYLITPSEKTVKTLCEDIRNKRYQKYHLFFTSTLSSELLKKIGGTPNIGNVVSLVELNIEFLVEDSNSFQFRHNNDLELIYGNQTKQEDRDAYASQIASKLLTLCVTMGEHPYIRYCKSNFTSTVAENLENLLQQFTKKNKLAKVQRNSVLLIVDRAIDNVSPLLHEFTYQAMSYDILDISDRNIYTHTFETKDGKDKKKKKVILDDNDEIWVKFKHKHIAETSVELQKDLKQYIEASGMKNINLKDRKKVGVDGMSDVMRKLPQFQKTMNNFSLHVSMTKALIEHFKGKKLDQVAEQEQNMAVGKDVDGKKLSDVIGNVSTILKQNEVLKDDKLRLIMIYLITQGVNKKKINQLLDNAGLGDKKDLVDNLLFMGVKQSKSRSLGKFLSSLFGKKSSSNNEVGYHLSRYVPRVKEITLEMVKGSLNANEYPYVTNPPSSFKITEVLKGGKEEKKSKVTTTTSRFDEDDEPAWNLTKTTSDPKEKKSNYKIFIFVIGGVTHSEMRSAFELQSETGMDVLIGGTSILTPKNFVLKVSQLKAPSDSKSGGGDDDELSI